MRALAFTRGEPRSETLDGVHVERVRPSLVLSNTPVRARYAAALLTRARSADAVVGHGPVPYALECAALAAALARKPFVATYHAGALVGGTPALDLVAGLHRRTLESAALSSADVVITVNPLVRDGYLARWRAKTEVVPPGVDSALYSPARAEREDARVLFVAPLDRSYRWKGWDVCYEAFRLLAERRADARLVVVGDGDRRAESEARAERDGLAKRIEFLGRVGRDALAREYARASVAVLASTSAAESFGMVLAEANAAATPVVASAVGGVPGFVEDGGNGLLVPPGDPRALAASVERLLASPDKARAMGERGREKVLREHDWDALASRTAAILSGTIANP